MMCFHHGALESHPLWRRWGFRLGKQQVAGHPQRQKSPISASQSVPHMGLKRLSCLLLGPSAWTSLPCGLEKEKFLLDLCPNQLGSKASWPCGEFRFQEELEGWAVNDWLLVLFMHDEVQLHPHPPPCYVWRVAFVVVSPAGLDYSTGRLLVGYVLSCPPISVIWHLKSKTNYAMYMCVCEF